MNRHSQKLRSDQQQEAVSGQEQQHKAEAREFASVEEMLRQESAHLTVPPGIAVRLNQSIAREPKSAPPSWWKRLFKNP